METLDVRTPIWPVVFAWLALVAWMLPIVGVPVGIITIVGGHKTRRPLVLTVGIISLMLACFNSGAGFMVGV